MSDFVMFDNGEIGAIDRDAAVSLNLAVAPPRPGGNMVRAAWDEAKHKRGQPGNKGEFGSGGASGAAPGAAKAAAGVAPGQAQIQGTWAQSQGPDANYVPTDSFKQSFDDLTMTEHAIFRIWTHQTAQKMGLGIARMDDAVGFYQYTKGDAPEFEPSVALYTAAGPSSEALAAAIGKKRKQESMMHFTPDAKGKDMLASIGTADDPQFVLTRAAELGIHGASVIEDRIQFAAHGDEKGTLEAVKKLHEEGMLNGDIKVTRGHLKFLVRNDAAKWRKDQETYDDVLRRHQAAPGTGADGRKLGERAAGGGGGDGHAADGQFLGEPALADRQRRWMERAGHDRAGRPEWSGDDPADPWRDGVYAHLEDILPASLGLAEFPDANFEQKHKRGMGGKFTRMFKIGALKQGMLFRIPGDKAKTRHMVAATSNTHVWAQDEHGAFKSLSHETVVEPHPKDAAVLANAAKAAKAGGGGDKSHPFASEPKPPPKPPPPPPEVGGANGEPLLQFSKAAGGSNGAYFAKDDQGTKWLVKSYRGNQDRVATEKLANSIYQRMGFTVADAQILHQGKKPVLAYPLMDGDTQRIDKPSKRLGDGFMTDALVGNWDVVGLADDNVLWTKDGEPIRIDQGGTFQFRAMGGNKDYGAVPTEVWSMLGLKKDGTPTQAQRGMVVTDEMKRQQAAEIAQKLTPPVIDKLVDAAPFKDEQMRGEVRDALKARVAWMGRFANGEETIPRPPDGDQAATIANQPMDLTSDEMKAFETFNTNPAHINDLVRGGDKESIRPLLTEMDGVLRDAKLQEPIVAYRSSSADIGEGNIGQTLTDDGYTRLSVDADKVPDGALVRITLPKGAEAVGMGLVGGDPREVLVRRSSRFKILSVGNEDGRTVVDAQLVPYAPPPPPKKPSSPDDQGKLL